MRCDGTAFLHVYEGGQQMEQERKSLRVGLAVIFCAAVLRLLSGGALDGIVQVLSNEELAGVIFYLESGRVVRPAPAPTDPPATTPETAATTPSEETAPVTVEDAALVQIINYTDLKPDLEQLILAAEFPELKGQAPTVLILHTHGSESYLAQPGYQEVSPFRTLDNGYNMVSVGEAVAQRLRQAGIGVIHDTTLHDHPDYNGAYSSARKSVRQYLEQYPSIRLVLDLHRDASDDYVNQLTTGALMDGELSSQLMMVVGTGHSGWQQNMSCGVQLHAWLEKTWPGMCRPISFRVPAFNQDLLPAMLLVEVGAAGDTHAQALRAADALAQGLIALSGS